MNPFIGEIIMFAGDFAPRGWALCDGQLLSISQHSALYSILGTTYGGDGRSTFALPDLRGRYAMHPGHGPGLSNHRAGEKGGVENLTLTRMQVPNYSIPVSLPVSGVITVNVNEEDATGTEAPGNRLGTTDTNVYNGDATDNTLAADSVSHSLAATGDINTGGGGQSHTNMPPYTCINFIISLEGVYPSRS